MNKITKVKKRNGEIVEFNPSRIKNAIFKALTASGQGDGKLAEKLTQRVVELIERRFKEDEIPHVEQIQDIVEEVLILENLVKAAKAYILYREQRRRIREAIAASEEAVERVDQYLGRLDWEVQENANMAFSLQGLNHYVTAHVIKKYWLNKIYPKEIKEANESGDLHLHNLDTLGAYCTGWDLYDLLLKGFGGVPTKIESRPPKHFRVALGQVVNFMYTLQGEVAGAIAFSNFDTLLAPFIRYDNLNYQQVKQAFQEFLFNMAVPCYDDKTEILTKDGFKLFKDLTDKDEVATLKDGKYIEYHKPIHRVKIRYRGEMIHIKTNDLDLLVTPNHKMIVARQTSKGRKVTIVRADKLKYNDWILRTGIWKGKEKKRFILPALKEKERFYSPITKKYHQRERIWKEKEIDMDTWLAFLGIYLAEGYAVKKSSKKAKEGNYEVGIICIKPQVKKEIRKILNKLPFKYRETEDRFIILDKQLWSYLRKLGDCYTKYIPQEFKELSARQLRLLLDAFNMGDGRRAGKRRIYYTSSKRLQDDIGELILKVGHSPRYYTQKDRKISIEGRVLHPSKEFPNLVIAENVSKYYTFTEKKYRKKDGSGYANFERVPYDGYVYSVEVPNHIVFVRRNGTCAWSGNTRVGFQSPFTNITLDLRPSPVFAKLPVIIGGKPQKETYGEFEEEMKIFNKALYEVYQEGDRNGKPFHFPIPTINITKDFPWDEPSFDGIFEASAKYGINYFANYINSDMKPEDVRSMCCRLRLNLTELYNRGGGGLFGAGSLTGSTGVVTINLPRIGYLSKTKKEFFQRLGEMMDLAKESLEIKRKVLENLTEKGLYPYSKYWLAGIKKARGRYWANHFSTIGLVGMNEACLNFLGENIASKRGRRFALEVLDFMRERLVKYQEETGNIYNLEQTPAESTSFRLALKDKEKYPDIITAGTKKRPYYTNSSQLPVNYTDDLFEALRLQDELTCKYTGGSVFHIFLGERMPSAESVKALVKKIFENFHLPYITITPTFSICPVHGYLSGEHFFCPKCTIKQPCEVYSRIVGYIRPISQWNIGKQQEFKERKEFKFKIKEISK
jgi:ribonucleoside-triphosphate reductase